MRVPEQFLRRTPVRRDLRRVAGRPLTPTEQAAALERHHYQALIRTVITEGGSVLVRCPYCLIYFREATMVDVTKFVDSDGKKECVTYCLRGHTLRFKPTDQWREARAKRKVVTA
jgi:hypothetical protein